MVRGTVTGEAPFAPTHMVGPWHEMGTFTGSGTGGGLSVGLYIRRIYGGTWAPTSRGKPFYCCLGETSSSTPGLQVVNGLPCIPH